MYIYVQFEDVKYEIYSDILFHISGNIHRCGGKSLSRIWLLVTSWSQRKEPLKCPRLGHHEGLKARGFGCMGFCHSRLRGLTQDLDRQGALSKTTGRSWKQGLGECVSPGNAKGGALAWRRKAFFLPEPFCPNTVISSKNWVSAAPQPAHWGDWLTWAGWSLPELLTHTLHWGPGNTFSYGSQLGFLKTPLTLLLITNEL